MAVCLSRELSQSLQVNLVRQALEAKLEGAKREVRDLEATFNEGADGVTNLTEEMFDELLEICSDLPGLFRAETTTVRDRKELIRRVLKYVVIERRTPETIYARIVWAEGALETSIEANLFRAAYPIIGELAAEGLGPGEIANRLNAMGLFTARRRQWSVDSVRAVLNRFRRTGM